MKAAIFFGTVLVLVLMCFFENTIHDYVGLPRMADTWSPFQKQVNHVLFDIFHNVSGS